MGNCKICCNEIINNEKVNEIEKENKPKKIPNIYNGYNTDISKKIKNKENINIFNKNNDYYYDSSMNMTNNLKMNNKNHNYYSESSMNMSINPNMTIHCKKNTENENNKNYDYNNEISMNIPIHSKLNTEIEKINKIQEQLNKLNQNDISKNMTVNSNFNQFTNNNSLLTENNEDLIECNFIYFDENISNSENYNYFLEFKKISKGIFFPCDSYKIFEKIILKLKLDSFNFILVCSGKVAEKFFQEQYKQFYNIIIFCYDVKKYKKLFSSRKEIQIYDNFHSVIKSLKAFKNIYKFSEPLNLSIYNNYNYYMDLNLKDKYKPTKFITFDDFQNKDKKYLKILLKNYPSNYNNLPYFSEESKKKLINCINLNNKIEKKDFLIKKINNINNSIDISKNIIETYIGETGIVYLVNRYLRECESNNYNLISGYISALIYSIEYLFNKNELYGVYYDVVLYRGIMLKISDICLYKISIGKLICFPGFTSTSSRKQTIINFPTDLAKKINELDNQYCVIMVFNYKYKNGNKSPVFNISKINPSEAEFLFPPFSFFKITKVEMNKGTSEDPIYIYLNVPNISFDFYMNFKYGIDIQYEKFNNTLFIE